MHADVWETIIVDNFGVPREYCVTTGDDQVLTVVVL